MTVVAMADDELAALFHEPARRAAPAYRRVHDLISLQIRSGKWKPGLQLPSESQLVRALGLSRMTVNRALRELAHDGLVTRTAGVGTFVAEGKTPSGLFEVRNIADDITQRGHRHRTEVVQAAREPGTAEEATDGRGEVLRTLLVHFEDDTPIQVEDRRVNPAAAPDYLEQDFNARTPHQYLSDIAPMTRGEHVVEAVLGSERECRLLRIERSEPCLLLLRRTWSGSLLVSTARLIHPGSRNRLEGEFGTS